MLAFSLLDRATFSKIAFQATTACDTLDPGLLSHSFIAYVCVGGPDRPYGVSFLKAGAGDSHTLVIARCMCVCVCVCVCARVIENELTNIK